MASTRPAPLQAWHDVVVSKDTEALAALLADECVFRSPAVFAPQQGKVLSTLYLRSALVVLGPTLRYLHEWFDESSAVLEFEADLDATLIHGIDMMRWDDGGQLTSFTVMVRPKRGLDALIDRMAAQLAATTAGQ